MSCRFCNPLQTSSLQADSQPLRDFEFARQELAAKQNARCVSCLLLYGRDISFIKHQWRVL